jgi:hypothetical protein
VVVWARLSSIKMDPSAKLVEVFDDALTCEMSMNIIRDEGKFPRVSNDIHDAMSNGSSDGGSGDHVEATGVVVSVSLSFFEAFFDINRFYDDLKVELKGGVVVTNIDKFIDVLGIVEKLFNEEEGGMERGGVEERSRHGERVLSCEKPGWLGCEFV